MPKYIFRIAAAIYVPFVVIYGLNVGDWNDEGFPFIASVIGSMVLAYSAGREAGEDE